MIPRQLENGLNNSTKSPVNVTAEVKKQDSCIRDRKEKKNGGVKEFQQHEKGIEETLVFEEKKMVPERLY